MLQYDRMYYDRVEPGGLGGFAVPQHIRGTQLYRGRGVPSWYIVPASQMYNEAILIKLK
jgi:hypothetical protein